MGPSRTPTKAEREWMAWIASLGCIACKKDGIEDSPASVHHIVKGNRRLGHLFTLPLCYAHHQGIGCVPSVHQAKRSFERRYGTELELLAELRALGHLSRAIAT